MLKIRVMPTILHKGMGLVKGTGFDSWRPVGSAMQAIRVYNLREVDELVFYDISATAEGREPDYELIDDLADDCFMPLAVGGGIRSLEHIRRLLAAGADKVVVGSAAVEDPALVPAAAERYGSQCVVVAIDARREGDRHEAWIRSGTRPTGLTPVALAQRLEAAGAGEIIITSIERDGTLGGYDIDLVRSVAAAVRIPVIASGGAGNPDHCLEAIQAGAAAVAAAAMFHFTEQTPMDVKRRLGDHGLPVRLT